MLCFAVSLPALVPSPARRSRGLCPRTPRICRLIATAAGDARSTRSCPLGLLGRLRWLESDKSQGVWGTGPPRLPSQHVGGTHKKAGRASLFARVPSPRLHHPCRRTGRDTKRHSCDKKLARIWHKATCCPPVAPNLRGWPEDAIAGRCQTPAADWLASLPSRQSNPQR